LTAAGNRLRKGCAMVVIAAVTSVACGQNSASTTTQPAETYETHAKGIRILPGQWRPHYPWEHIAWISPPWPSQDYVWFDFPEAIFTKQGMLYLSHVNPTLPPALFSDPPAVPWEKTADGLQYERVLPNGFRWRGRIRRVEPLGADEHQGRVDFELAFENDSKQSYTEIRLQTCLMLRACQEFGAYSADNKSVHVPERGWLPFEQARTISQPEGKVRLGWRGGPMIADWPVMVTRSAVADRYVAMTWFDNTYSLIQNPPRPCMHADPFVPDLPPGEHATIRGRIWFFDGPLEPFEKNLKADLKNPNIDGSTR
jgi:hypothetical protein